MKLQGVRVNALVVDLNELVLKYKKFPTDEPCSLNAKRTCAIIYYPHDPPSQVIVEITRHDLEFLKLFKGGNTLDLGTFDPKVRKSVRQLLRSLLKRMKAQGYIVKVGTGIIADNIISFPIIDKPNEEEC